MRNPNVLPQQSPEDQEASPEAIEAAKRRVVEAARVWTEAARALEQIQTEIARDKQIRSITEAEEAATVELEERAEAELEAAKQAFHEALWELQLLAGSEVMSEVYNDLEALMAEAERDN